MADFSLVTEIVIDAAPSTAGADQAVAQLDRIAAASARAAAAVAGVSASLQQQSTTQGAAANAAATEAAILRQSNAVEGVSGAMIQLTRTSKDLETASAGVSEAIMMGAVSAQVGGAELSAYAARQAEVTAAQSALRSGQMDLAQALIAYPGLLRASGTEAAAMAAAHAKATTALEAFRTGQADVAAVVQRMPSLIGANVASFGEYQAAHASATATIEKFVASGMSADQFLNRYPGLVAQSGDAADSMRVKHAALATQLETFRAQQLSANEIVGRSPSLLGAAGSSANEMATRQAALTKAFEELAAGSISAEQMIARFPQLATPAGTAALNMATRIATVGPAARAAGAEAEEAGGHIANAWSRSGRAGEAMVLVHEGISGRFRQAISSMMIELQNFGLMQSIVAGLTNPFILALGAVVTVLIAAGLRLIDVASNMRAFGAAIQVTNTQGQVTSAQLQGMVEHLRDMGVGAAEAFKSVHELSLNPFINPNAIPVITEAGARLSQLNTGGLDKTAEYTSKLETAIKSGTAAVVKFGVEVGAISGEQAHSIEEMQRHEGSIRATDNAFQLILQHLPSVQSQMSGAKDETISLGVAWRELLKQVGESPIYSGLDTIAKGLIATLRGLVSAIADAQSLINRIPGGTQQNTLGLRQYIDPALAAAGRTALTIAGISGQAVTGEEALAPGATSAATDATKQNVDATKKLTTALDQLGDKLATAPFGVATANAPGIQVTGAAGAPTVKALGDYITQTMGWSPERAAALLAQGQGETGLNPLENSPTGAGMFEWDKSRFHQLQDFATSINTTWQDWRAQLQFAGKEIAQKAPEFFSQTSLNDLNATLVHKFEISKNQDSDIAKRLPYAQQALTTITGQIPSVAGGATTEQGTKYLEDQKAALDRLAPSYKLTGEAAEEYKVRLQAENEAIGHVADAGQAKLAGDQAVTAFRQRNADTLDRETQLRKLQTQADLDGVTASRQSEVAGIAQQAIDDARVKALQRLGTEVKTVTSLRSASFAQESDAARQAAQNLELKAVQDLRSANASVLAMDVQISANRRLSTGYAESTAAGRQVALENQATSITHNSAATAAAAHVVAEKALADAVASGDEKRKAQAQELVATTQKTMELAAAEQALAASKLTVDEAFKTATGLDQATNSLKDQVAQNQLITSLQGHTTEQINTQVELLKAQQKIKNDNVSLDKTIAGAQASGNTVLEQQARTAKDVEVTAQQRYATEVAIDAKVKEQEADAQRAQQRMDSAARSVAGTILSQIGTALDNAFSGQKAQSWGDTMKTILRDLLKQIVEFTLIQPAIGTALGALGFAQVAQQFGSFGNLFGGGNGSQIDPVSGLTNATTSGSGGTLSTLLNGAGLLGKAGNLFSGNSGGGLASLFGLGGASTDIGATIAGTGGLTSEALLAAPATAELGAGLVSQTALSAGGISSALSGAGGALGGILGTVGAAIPYVGIAIGAASLIAGLLGNKKPSNLASGDLLDLASGTSSGFTSSGNAQNDAAVRQASATLQQFLRTVTAETGGTAPTGAINLVATTKGFEASYSGALGNIKATFASAQDAINAIELAIAQNLTNVSDTLKTVLSKTSDPSQIQANVAFATSYDNLKKAEDSAFSSISTDTQAVGPFTTSLQSVQKTFADLTTQAKQFDLALDPINAGLAEATTRLQGDDRASLQQAIDKSSGNDFLNGLTTVAQQFATNTRDAISIGLGGDAGTAAQIAAVERAQALEVLAPLTAAQLQTVVARFQSANPEIASMAQAMLDAGASAQKATASVTDLTSGLKSITDTIASLRGGALSGLPPAQQAAASAAAYQAELGRVGGLGAALTANDLSGLATAANDAIKASQTAYGEGPQTAALRARVLSGLTALAAATPATLSAPGAATLSGSAAVAAAQAAAALRAGAGTTSLIPGFAGGTERTPPGPILVGERGPELIFQGGGASVIPISQHDAYQWRGPAFAGGTGDVPALLQQVVGMLGVLHRQSVGNQKQATQDSKVQTGHLVDISRNVARPLAEPRRQGWAR